MTLRYIEGFDYFPAGTGQSDRLLEAGGYYLRAGNGLFDVPNLANNMTTGRFGFGKCLSWGGQVGTQASRVQLVKPISPGMSFTTATLGFAMSIGRTSAVPFSLQFYDAISDAPQCSVELGTNGVIRVYRGGTTALLGTSWAGAYYFDEWFYLEVKATVNGSAGAVEVRVNTVPVVNLISQNTQATAIAGFDSYCFATRSVGLSNAFTAAVDDGYVCDDAGAVNTSFLGNVRVKTQFPAGVGDVTTWAPTGAATNWQAALNTALDDTKYNASNVAGDEDLYALEAILGPQTIHGVQIRSGLRQTDATQRTARNRLKVSGVETDSGVDHYLNQTFTYYTDIIELNPSTGLGMTGTQLNAGQVGPKVQA